MYWFRLNMPLAAAFFGATVGIPVWLIFKRPGWVVPAHRWQVPRPTPTRPAHRAADRAPRAAQRRPCRRGLTACPRLA